MNTGSIRCVYVDLFWLDREAEKSVEILTLAQDRSLSQKKLSSRVSIALVANQTDHLHPCSTSVLGELQSTDERWKKEKWRLIIANLVSLIRFPDSHTSCWALPIFLSFAILKMPKMKTSVAQLYGKILRKVLQGRWLVRSTFGGSSDPQSWKSDQEWGKNDTSFSPRSQLSSLNL